MAESDAAFCEVIRGKFKGNFVARQNTDTVAAKPTREVRQDQALVLKLHTEFSAGKFLDDGTLYFDAVFFAHSSLFKTKRSRS